MKAKEFREKTSDELDRLIADRTDDLMHFRMQMATGVVDNVRLARNARRDIARIRTILNERTREAASSAAKGDKR